MVSDGGLAILRAVHDHPGIGRADVARQLDISSGAASDLVARLAGLGLVTQGESAPAGGRGRPTRSLVPHPEGPVVLAAAFTYESWHVQVVELGGGVLASRTSSSRSGDGNRRSPADMVRAAATVLRDARDRYGSRVRGLGVSVPGVVQDARIVSATDARWVAVDLSRLGRSDEVVVIGNDASLASLAEARRGAAQAALLALHVRIDAGLGGAIVERGRLVEGAGGSAGEFGHLPFGDRSVPCPCGAHGCWGTAVDGGAIARRLGEDEPRDPMTYGRVVIARAASGDKPALRAVRTVATALGRGIAGVVNAFDADVVTVGGLGADLLGIAEAAVLGAYRDGLMSFRRDRSPVPRVAALADRGPVTGAAEQVWDQLWVRWSDDSC